MWDITYLALMALLCFSGGLFTTVFVLKESVDVAEIIADGLNEEVETFIKQKDDNGTK